MMRIALLVLSFSVSQPYATSLAANDYEGPDIYSSEDLAKDQVRYEGRVGELFRALWSVMNEDEKQALRGVKLEQPLKGSTLLLAYSFPNGDTPTVVLPVLGLKFFEDLSVAYAWRYVNNYSFEPIDIYVAMLRYRKPEDFPGGRMPDPLTALGVPPRIWENDKKVDELSLRFRNSAWAFILAHELGHLRYHHRGNRNVDPQVSQQNETAADAFAMDILGRAKTIPMGMILWFMATIDFSLNRADFGSDAEYQTWLRSKATHPVKPQRLQNLAVELDHAADVANAKDAEILRFIAVKVSSMAETLAEPDAHRVIARCAVLARPDDLKRLQGSPCSN